MVDKASNRATSRVDDHVLVEEHEIEALRRWSASSAQRNHLELRTYLIILVDIVHPRIGLFLCDDLASVLDDDLIWFESAVASHPVPSVDCFDDLDPDIVFAAFLDSLSQGLEAAVATLLFSQSAITIITLVEHESVHAIAVTSTFGPAYTS